MTSGEPPQVSARAALLRRGIGLEGMTVGYNALEGLIAIVAGLAAGSVALTGFGVDSVIEVTSGVLALIVEAGGMRHKYAPESGIVCKRIPWAHRGWRAQRKSHAPPSMPGTPRAPPARAAPA